MQTSFRQPGAAGTGAAAGLSRFTAEVRTLGRALLKAIAIWFNGRPDRLANEKFTDAFERELAGQAFRNPRI
jgi:hypothetical protein